ncbi:hypothetical protein [Bacillus cereus]|nr:hypothetical protein [Bacillus cereus]
MVKKLKRGRSQVLFRFLPGSVFMEDKKWYQVTDMELNKLNEKTTHLLEAVRRYINDWNTNAGLSTNLFPEQDELYFFGEIDQIEFSLFPLVFRCNNRSCRNVHQYFNLEDLSRKNPELRCQFCSKDVIKQYPYALVHLNGDLQSINVKTNKGAKNWHEKYDGIRMRDTRRFTTATWYNYKKQISLGDLGTKRTNLPLTEEMIQNNKRFLGGTHLSEGDIHYPALKSMVNLEQQTLIERKEHESFTQIQMAALLQLDSINTGNYAQNFEIEKNNSTLQILLESAKNEEERRILLKTIKNSDLGAQFLEGDITKEVEEIFQKTFPIETVEEDRLLHEFLFSWYENDGQTIEAKLEEARINSDLVQETSYIQAQNEVENLGLESVALLEKFPVITMGVGYTRKSFDRNRSILNPFRKQISNKRYTVIPVLKNDNEAIIFKLDPLRILRWLEINKLITFNNESPNSKREAHAILYNYLLLSKMEKEDLVMLDPKDYVHDQKVLATIMTYQLVHTMLHMLLHAGKSIIGLDVDSMSEYIFPSALAGTIYVSKLQGGGMGALIAAFENDLERWLRNTYEKTQTCLYDPICKGQHGACHACSYLKFSCQHFNRGLSRNLLTGGYVGETPIIGYFSKELDEVMKKGKGNFDKAYKFN